MTATTTVDGPTTIHIDRDARTFVMERTFDAPRDLVFKAWSSCEYLRRWWGPTGWTLPTCELDFRPGGIWFYGMQGPADDATWAGVVSYGKATFREIVAPILIVFLDQFARADGTAMPDMPETVATVDFVDLDGRTKIINTAQYASAEALDQVVAMGMAEGATQTWDRLEALLVAETPPA